MVIFAIVELVRFLRLSPVKGILGILLIAMFAVKSCDVFIHYCASHTKSVSTDGPADDQKSSSDENSNPGEKCFEKDGKKLYSFFENDVAFRSVIQITDLSNPHRNYISGIITEPLRVVPTPPPDRLLA